MEYNDESLAALISEVETEFKDYLTKSEQAKEEVQAEAVSEETIEKSEEDFDYDESDIAEMDEMYASMNKSEAMAHFESLSKTLGVSADVNKSEEAAEEVEQDLKKSEQDETNAKKDEEIASLKKSLETLTSIVTKVVKGAPKRKAVTGIEYIKKSEEDVVTKSEESKDYSKMSKKEINGLLTEKIKTGGLKKSEKDLIDSYCFGQAQFKDIEHLL